MDHKHRVTDQFDVLESELIEISRWMYDNPELVHSLMKFTRDAVIQNLRNFNQQLVDYTAMGHFEIYERIIDGKERRGNIKLVADRVYPKISLSTEAIVDFNDKYEGADESDSLTDLYRDLSTIGEAMAERIEAEDELLHEISDNLETPARESQDS